MAIKGQKRCKECRKLFMPRNSLTLCCSIQCGVAYARNNGTGIEVSRKRALKERIEAARPLKYWQDRTQATVNAYVRLRDRDLPCISCGKKTGAKMNAGHWRSRGARPDIRYDAETNIFLQCEHCNTYRSGHIQGFREGLIAKYGEAWVIEQEETPPTIRRYRREDLEEIKAHYGKLINAIKADI
jgi:hypothetical protein